VTNSPIKTPSIHPYGSDIPSWFSDLATGQGLAITDAPTLGERNQVVAKSLDHMYLARAAFKDDAHHATLVLIALITGTCYALAKAVEGDAPERALASTMSVVGSLSVAGLCKTYSGKLYAGYRLYVAACIQAAITSYGAGLAFTHEWFRDIAIRCNEPGWFYESVRLQPGGWRATVFRRDILDRPLDKDWWRPIYDTLQKPKSISDLSSVWMATGGNLWLLHRRTLRHVMMVQRFLMICSFAMLSFSGAELIGLYGCHRWTASVASVLMCGLYLAHQWCALDVRRSYDDMVGDF